MLFRSQDCFIRDHLRPQDVVIISAGGNDIALRPSLRTIWNMLKLIHLNSLEDIERNPGRCWGMPYFEHYFLSKIVRYVAKLTSNVVPAAVVVCMI